MKKITLFLFALFTCWQINAQVSAYSFSETTETYAQITGTTSTATGDDGTQNGISIGFNFVFGGTTYTTFSITTNGMIRLGGNITGIFGAFSNALSNTAENRPLIAPLWDDNHLGSGTIRYAVTGSSPNQVLTVNFHNTKIGDGNNRGADVSWLLRLYETTNVIEIVYSNPFTTTNTVSASVGINDTTSFLSVTPAATSTVSSATANNAIDAATMANLAGKKLTFSPPSCAPPAATTSIVNDCANSQYFVNVNVTDLGNGSPVITDGTTTWPVSAIGVVNVGPFASGSSVTLTLLHGSDATCNLPLGSFNYACPPANDDCVNAIALTPGGVFADYPVVGTTVNATTVTGLTYACQTNRANDVWYSVVVPASGTITIETQANGGSALTDTVLSVFSGTCGALVEVGCDDDNGVDAFSIVNLTQPAGTTLYIGVWRWSSATNGTFQVSAYDASLSSGSFDNANFSAYPNPVKDVLNVSYSTEISSIRVINMIGQEVISKTINATSSQVDMSQLSAGTYIVNVAVGDAVKTLKVVKQ